MSDAFLAVAPPPGDVRAIALVLHGGRAKSSAPVRERQLTVVRMKPFVTTLVRDGALHGLAVARLRYAVRGWNGDKQSPLHDVRHALDQLTARFPERPIALVGHSMGGRAALHEAGHSNVDAIVALAPWIERGDPIDGLRGRRVLIAHGTRDRTTSPKASAALARHLQGIAASASFVAVHREGHGLIRRARLWHELTSAYVLATVCDVAPGESVGTDATNVVRNAVQKALAGEPVLEV